MPLSETGMARALSRIILVLFLAVAVSYQSWSIIVPPDSTGFLFTATPAAKLIPSLFDIDDEHRSAQASLPVLPAPLFVSSASLVLAQTRGHFPLELRFNRSTVKRLSVVLLI